MRSRPSGAPPIRALRPRAGLTLDLWFTTLYFSRQDRAVWREERLQVLRESLVDPHGTEFPEKVLTRGVEDLSAKLYRRGRKLSTLTPAEALASLASHLGGRVRNDLATWASRLSEAGLRRRPPKINPEVQSVVRWARARRIPVACLTNSSRPGTTWEEFFRRCEGPRFDTVVTSCDTGRAKPAPEQFRFAAAQLQVPPSRLVHVGDCWHADVQGARTAGVSPALYRGLWSRYPDPGQRRWEDDADDGGPDVLRLDDLRGLPDQCAWQRPAAPPRTPRPGTRVGARRGPGVPDFSDR